MRVQVYGGLCNRLRAVLSRLTPDGLTVVWEPNDEIAHGRFLDVFEPLPGVRFDEVAHPTDFKTLEPANGDWWHRTEQAILTMLAHKYGYPLWREADQDGNEWIGRDPGDYPQLFEQVRRGGPFPVGTGSRFRNVPMPEKDT